MPYSPFDELHGQFLTRYEILLGATTMQQEYAERNIRLREVFNLGIKLCKARIGSVGDIERLITEAEKEINDEAFAPRRARTQAFEVWADGNGNYQGESPRTNLDMRKVTTRTRRRRPTRRQGSWVTAGVGDEDENMTYETVAIDLQDTLRAYMVEYADDVEADDYQEITSLLQAAIAEATTPVRSRTPHELWTQVSARLISVAQMEQDRRMHAGLPLPGISESNVEYNAHASALTRSDTKRVRSDAFMDALLECEADEYTQRVNSNAASDEAESRSSSSTLGRSHGNFRSRIPRPPTHLRAKTVRSTLPTANHVQVQVRDMTVDMQDFCRAAVLQTLEAMHVKVASEDIGNILEACREHIEGGGVSKG